jgi:hypothetical protein
MEFNASEEWLRKTAEAGANINIGSPSPGSIIFFVPSKHSRPGAICRDWIDGHRACRRLIPCKMLYGCFIMKNI